MSNKEKQLQVGDIIYSGMYTVRSLYRYKIVRVTKTRAFSDSMVFQREYFKSGTVNTYPRAKGWNSSSYTIATTKLDREYRKQTVVGILNAVKWDDHNIETLELVREQIGA